MSELKATACVLTGGILCGLLPLFAKTLAGKGFSPEQVVFFRVGFAALFLTLWLAIRAPSLLRLRLADIWFFACLGIGSLMMLSYCYLLTIESGGIALAALLLYTSPAFVLVFSVLLFKERVTKRKLLAVVCTLTGCAFITGFFGNPTANVTWPVIVVGLGSGFFYSLYSIFGKYALRRYNPLTVIVYAFIFATIGISFMVPLPQTLGRLTDISALFVSCGMAILCSLGAYGFYTLGLRGMAASKAGVLATIELVVSTLIGILMFHEQAFPQTFIGMGLILGTTMLLNTASVPKERG